MAAGNDLDSGGEGQSNINVTSENYGGGSESRQRLRPWLINQLDKNLIDGLEWIDKQIFKFKIPWKHGGKQDWVPDQGKIFMEWARHTGKYNHGVDTPQYAKWKTNLRCALNKAPDIKEVKEESSKHDSNPFKVYQFLPRQNKKQKCSNHLEDTRIKPQMQPVSAPQYVEVPTFVQDFTNSNSLPSNGQQPALQGVDQQINSLLKIERLPSDLYSLQSGDLVQHPQNAINNTNMPTHTETMDYHTMSQASDNRGSDSQFIQNQPTSELFTSPPIRTPDTYQFVATQNMTNQPLYTTSTFIVQGPAVKTEPVYVTAQGPVSETTFMNTLESSTEFGSQFVMTPSSNTNLLASPPNEQDVTSNLTFDSIFPQSATNVQELSEPKSAKRHICNATSRCEMYIEILYRGYFMDSKHITTTKGCRIVDKNDPTCESLPPVLNEALYGKDSKDRDVVELPRFPKELGDQFLMQSATDLLSHMNRGLLLDCKNGDINAIRICQTSVYYRSMFNKLEKLIRHEDALEITKIFDVENHFKSALEKYKNKTGERPDPYVYLYIGQKQNDSKSKDSLGHMLLVLRVTSCEALKLLREVEMSNNESLPSLHISNSTEFDKFGNTLRQQAVGNDAGNYGNGASNEEDMEQ